MVGSQAERPRRVPPPAAVIPTEPPAWQLLLGILGALAVLAAGIHHRRHA